MTGAFFDNDKHSETALGLCTKHYYYDFPVYFYYFVALLCMKPVCAQVHVIVHLLLEGNSVTALIVFSL